MTMEKNGDLLPPYFVSIVNIFEKLAGRPNVVVEGDIDYPFEDVTGSGDENKIRGNWGSSVDFIFSAIALVIGLGNIWRFPYYVANYGGLAFLIPYILTMVIVCIPAMLLELSLGQFASLGCTAVWRVCPLFKGIGIGMLLVTCVLCMYNNVLIAWAFHYLISSVRPNVPWVSCHNTWNSRYCSEWSRSSISDCSYRNGTLLRSGFCASDLQLEMLRNSSQQNVILLEDSEKNWKELNRTLPSLEYFREHVLGLSSGLGDVGTIQWQLALYLLLAWLITFFALFKSIKTSGKVVYVTVLLPYMTLLVLFVRAITREGATEGIAHFLTPKWDKLMLPEVWGIAATQSFYSLSICWGGLTTLASYNRFHNNIFRDVWIIGVVDVLTSCLSCILTYATIGFMCHELGWSYDDAMVKGPNLIFVMYTEALARLSVAPIWSAIFFITIILIALDTQLFLVETIVSSICDEFAERLRKNHRHVLSLVCLICYASGIPFCTQAGLYLIQLVEYFLTTHVLLILAFLQVMAVCWVYGVDNLLDNIKWMTHYYPPPYILWKLIWKFLSPCVILATLICTWFYYKPITVEDYEYPDWALFAGWAISFVPIIMVPLFAIIKFCMLKGGFIERVHALMSPDDDWGPALAVHRAEQFPLQIPEAREPMFRRGPSIPPPPREQSPSAEAPLIPKFDRETAI